VRKRYYIFIVTHDWDGQLRRIPIPVQWVVLFLVFAVVGASTLLGLAGSYSRMLSKVEHFNELRQQQDVLTHQLANAQHETEQTRAEVASLGSLASQVASLYSLGRNATLKEKLVSASVDNPGITAVESYSGSLANFQVLQNSALNGSLLGVWSNPPGSWRPSIWPVTGRITSSFGERLDPFGGEGSFHDGLDIATSYGTPVHVSAPGQVIFSGVMNGYGRTVIVDHGHGLRTLYAHLSAFASAVGQHVQRGDEVGFVGLSGRSTGAHLHYEVRIDNAAVNPHKYLQ